MSKFSDEENAKNAAALKRLQELRDKAFRKTVEERIAAEKRYKENQKKNK
jgi:hypothetical protein